MNETYGIVQQSQLDSINADKAKYGRSIQTTTYSPYLGAILAGDHSQSSFNVPDPYMSYGNQFLAKISKPGNNFQSFEASKNDTKSDYKRRIFQASANIPKAEYTASLKQQLIAKIEKHNQREAFIASGGNPMYSPNRFNASVPPGGNDSAAQVVGPLTQIPYIQSMMGVPQSLFLINQLTTKFALPQLHAERPETDYGMPLMQLEPTQFVENRRPDFDSHFFHAKRNEYAFVIPREYRYRATIDPYNYYIQQANYGIQAARDALTLYRLSFLPKMTEGFAVYDNDSLPDPAADNAGGYPSADNNSKAIYSQIFAKYFTKTRKSIDSIVMNPVDFVNYESNFYTNGWQGYEDATSSGMVQFPGFKDAKRTVISPFCPKGVAYFFNSDFVLTGEGPMVTEAWAKPEANSDAGAIRDYVDVAIFNPFRAGFKAIIDGSASDFSEELTTLQKARNAYIPPTNLLEKNQ